jgi:hypothetical protein
MSMARELHRIMGFSIVAGWALLFLIGATLAIRKREAGRLYWRLLVVLEVALGLQVVAGLVVFASGGRPPVLHYVYGAIVPALLLLEAHVFARRFDGLPNHALFTITAFVNLLLGARALQTGLGL